jgi:hypothetical protein
VTKALRHRCRNQRCRTKLEFPTDNYHKAFCSPHCYNQFYIRRCKVCEKELPREASPHRNCCRSKKCQADFRKYRHAYTLPPPIGKVDAKSACGTGTIFGLKAPPGSRLIAGPPLSDFSLGAATLPDLRPQRAAPASWQMQRQPGDLAAEWTAREWARREADDAEYVAKDEQRLRTEPVDASGNYALRPRGVCP